MADRKEKGSELKESGATTRGASDDGVASAPSNFESVQESVSAAYHYMSWDAQSSPFLPSFCGRGSSPAFAPRVSQEPFDSTDRQEPFDSTDREEFTIQLEKEPATFFFTPLRSRSSSPVVPSRPSSQEPGGLTDRGAAFTIRLEKTPEMKQLGLSMQSHKEDRFIEVAKLRKQGLLLLWNAEHPDMKVMEGDLIVAVNGKRGPRDFLYECIGEDTVLELTIERTAPCF